MDELARRLVAQTRPGATAELSVGAEAGQSGVSVEHVLARMQEVVAEEGRLARVREQDEQRLVRLRERAESARTPEGQGRLREESGLRGQMSAARRQAAEAMGPPRELFRGAEREDKEAAQARRFGARIAEQEEGKAARAAARDDRAKQRAEERAERASPEYRQAAQLGQLRARAEFQRTPEGQAALREESGLKQELAEQRRQAAGEPGTNRARSFALAAGRTAAAVYLTRRVLSGVENAAEAANPEAAGTFAGSQQMLQQAAGEGRVAQNFSRGSSALMQNLAQTLRGEKSVGAFLTGGQEVRDGRIVPPKDMLQNLSIPGVRGESFQGGEDYYFSLQRAVSEAGANTLDARNMADQLRTMREQNDLLGDLKDNTKALRRGIAAWRQ